MAVETPLQMVVVVEVKPVGAVGPPCTVTVAKTPSVASVQLLFPILRTQYVVVSVGYTNLVVAANAPKILLPTVVPVP
jgi:hypothetical protein